MTKDKVLLYCRSAAFTKTWPAIEFRPNGAVASRIGRFGAQHPAMTSAQLPQRAMPVKIYCVGGEDPHGKTPPPEAESGCAQRPAAGPKYQARCRQTPARAQSRRVWSTPATVPSGWRSSSATRRAIAASELGLSPPRAAIPRGRQPRTASF
jgi:hypothetical protein